MASRRNLKKVVKNISGELFADCVLLRLTEQADRTKVEELMRDIATMYAEFVARINHTEKGSEALFYKKLHKEFTDTANRIHEELIKA